jgi:hypothetical protein
MLVGADLYLCNRHTLSPPARHLASGANRRIRHYPPANVGSGDAPDFVEVGEVGIAMDDAMRRQRRVQLVG